jgi:hypothetical protein
MTFSNLGKETRQAKAVSTDEQIVFGHLAAPLKLARPDTSVHLVH